MGLREFTSDEAVVAGRLAALKDEAGSHSPSLLTLREQMPELEIAVDACFISNPYATQLFLDYFKSELLDTGAIRDVLEFYPSQNQVIGALLAGHLGIPEDRVFVGNGAIEIIQAVIHNFAKRRVLVTLPTFSSYYEFAEGRVDVVFHTLAKTDEFKLDPHDYLAKVAETAPEVVRGIQQGLIQEVIDRNAAAIGRNYLVTVTPDARGGSCEVGLKLEPHEPLENP